MIGYVCKYTPIELFEAMEEEVERIEPNVSNFDHADSKMHPNMCCYSKAVFEHLLTNNYDGLILTTCCDSIRRLYDALKVEFPNKFIYLLDIPHKNNAASEHYYHSQVTALIQAYEDFSGKTFIEANLKNYFASHKADTPSYQYGSTNIGIMGARCSQGVLDVIKATDSSIIFNLTCTGIGREYDASSKQLLEGYTSSILKQFPCMRMETANGRFSYLSPYTNSNHKLDGIIYHTVKFCDHYSYEYAYLKKHLNVPILKIETDYSSECEGQIKTRVEAFIESIRNNDLSVHHEDTPSIKSSAKNLSSNGLYVMGIDSGSTSTNAVILDKDHKIVAYSVVRTGAKSGESANKALKTVLEKAGLTQDDLSLIVSTGYGRVSIPFANKNVTEISCHGKGAHYLNPNVRTIIDIGGQDSKAIKVNADGEVTDFVMNDKCAAGTGRFLEMIARTLEIDIKDMGPESLGWKEDITISSMCSVFAESEVISLIAQNKERADIIHGIHKAIAAKSLGLVSRIGKESGYMMTGGVAQNVGMVQAIEEKLGEKLFISDEPEIVGAIGAALLGLEEFETKNEAAQ